jgi:hypothetical protein
LFAVAFSQFQKIAKKYFSPRFIGEKTLCRDWRKTAGNQAGWQPLQSIYFLRGISHMHEVRMVEAAKRAN